jgi:hypothetical protein
MVGPNRWVDEGPGNGTRGLAYTAIGGRAVGAMVPDRPAPGPILEARSDGTNKLGITPRKRRWNGAPLEP